MMGIDSCGMLLSAVHEEEGEEKLHLLMVDNHIPEVQSSIKKYRFTLQNGMYFICEKALKIHKYTKFTPNGA